MEKITKIWIRGRVESPLYHKNDNNFSQLFCWNSLIFVEWIQLIIAFVISLQFRSVHGSFYTNLSRGNIRTVSVTYPTLQWLVFFHWVNKLLTKRLLLAKLRECSWGAASMGRSLGLWVMRLGVVFGCLNSSVAQSYTAYDLYPFLILSESTPYQESFRDSPKPTKHRFLFFSIETLENSRQYLGNKLGALSTGMDTFFVDSFFSDEDFEPLDGTSRMRISLQSFQEEGESADFKLDVRGTLALPLTENRINLLFESDDEDETTDRSSSPIDAVNSQGYRAAFRFLLDVSRSWDVDFDAGIKLRAPLEPFVRLRGRRTIHFVDWDARISQTFYWFNSIGGGETTRFELIRNIGYDKWFTINTQADYRLENEYFTFDHHYSLYHELTDRSASAFRMGFHADNEDEFNVSLYFIDWRYRRRAYKDWLFWEVKPQITFPEDRDFEATPGLLMKIEMYVSG